MINAQEVLPRWIVVLGRTMLVFRAHDQNGDWPDRKAPSVPYTYFVRAQDELEAFTKARKMEKKK